MTSSARNILVVMVLLGIVYWLWKPGITQKPVVDKVAKQANLPGQIENEVDKKVDRPSSTPTANTSVNESPERPTNQGTQLTPPKDEVALSHDPITVQAARRMAWDSMPTEPKAMDEFFALKELSANRPPPSEGARIDELEAQGMSPQAARKIQQQEAEIEEYQKKVAQQAIIIDLLKKLQPSTSLQPESELTGLIDTTRKLARSKRHAK